MKLFGLLQVHPRFSPFIHLSFVSPLSLSIFLSICLSVCLSVRFICLSVCLSSVSLYLFVYISVSVCTFCHCPEWKGFVTQWKMHNHTEYNTILIHYIVYIIHTTCSPSLKNLMIVTESLTRGTKFVFNTSQVSCGPSLYRRVIFIYNSTTNKMKIKSI